MAGLAALLLADLMWSVWLYQRTTVAVSNQSGVEIYKIKVTVSAETQGVEQLGSQRTHSFVVHPQGEASVFFSFVNPSQKTIEWEGGYLERRGWYQLLIVVGPDAQISARYENNFGILVGPTLYKAATKFRDSRRMRQ